jgi:hypothetical protein
MAGMETTWNDLPGPPPRCWGLPALTALRRLAVTLRPQGGLRLNLEARA